MSSPARSTPATDPRISVVIPAYNDAALLPDAIASVRGQTCQDWEVIVVDDGSTDETAAVLRALRLELGDRLQVLVQENGGSAAARNRGVAAARGPYIAFLDADDRFTDSDKLMDQRRRLDDDADLGAVQGGWDRVDASGTVLATVRPWERSPDLTLVDWLRWKPVKLSALMIRTAWLERVGGLDESLRQSHDVDLMLRLSLAGCRFAWLRRSVVAYRLHGGNTTRNSEVQAACVERWLLNFFARDDIPPSARAIERQVCYDTYVWLAWYHITRDRWDLMARELEKSIAFFQDLPVELPAVWASRFVQMATSEIEPFPLETLLTRPEWQALVLRAIGVPERDRAPAS